MRWTGQLLIVLALLIVGCARGDWIDKTLTLVDVTGTWEGVFKFSEPTRGLERATRWVLRQNGGRVRGEAEGLHGAQLAPIEGLVNGEVLSWQLTGQFFRWAPGTSYRGEAMITIDEMSGRADGPNCPCTVLLRRAGSDVKEKEQAR
jgi:hypothetical protein